MIIFYKFKLRKEVTIVCNNITIIMKNNCIWNKGSRKKRNAKSRFYSIRRNPTYIHSPQASNEVKVSLTKLQTQTFKFYN